MNDIELEYFDAKEIVIKLDKSSEHIYFFNLPDKNKIEIFIAEEAAIELIQNLSNLIIKKKLEELKEIGAKSKEDSKADSEGET